MKRLDDHLGQIEIHLVGLGRRLVLGCFEIRFDLGRLDRARGKTRGLEAGGLKIQRFQLDAVWFSQARLDRLSLHGQRRQ